MQYERPTSSATDCLAHVFLTWLYIIVLLIPSPQNITNAWETEDMVMVLWHNSIDYWNYSFWGPHLKQPLICIVERLSVQAIQNLSNTFRKATRPLLNPGSRPIDCFLCNLPIIWWVRFQMGTHKTDLIWKPEAWSACKGEKTGVGSNYCSCEHECPFHYIRLRSSSFIVPPPRSRSVGLDRHRWC